ncbi:hypothetical protein MHBO_003821 [Bonamia ostreae]|uniref:Uncharacterized protein n=1 Tax=Bonamia ostreae TaxID=126728 RepID=A0ABV2ARZ8_9EUKA
MISRIHLGKEYMDCFLTKDLIQEISSVKKVKKKQAMEMGQNLLKHGYISGFKEETELLERRTFYTFKNPDEVIPLKKNVENNTNLSEIPIKKTNLKPSKPKKPAKLNLESENTKKAPQKKEPPKKATESENERIAALEKMFEEERKKREELERQLEQQKKTSSKPIAQSAAKTVEVEASDAKILEKPVTKNEKSETESDESEYEYSEYYSEYTEYSDSEYTTENASSGLENKKN